MRSCGEYRLMARQSLQGNWGTFMSATIIYTLVSFGLSKISVLFRVDDYKDLLLPLLLSLLVGIVLEALNIGLSRMALEYASINQSDFSSMLQGFQCVDKVLLWSIFYTVGTFFLTCLCIIPGVIFAYTYAMVPFILADDPETGFGEALSMSSNMMRGRRFDLFVLQLSFIGWAILAVCTCGIGNIALVPYRLTAMAHFYIDLKS